MELLPLSSSKKMHSCRNHFAIVFRVNMSHHGACTHGDAGVPRVNMSNHGACIHGNAEELFCRASTNSSVNQSIGTCESASLNKLALFETPISAAIIPLIPSPLHKSFCHLSDCSALGAASRKIRAISCGQSRPPMKLGTFRQRRHG